MDDPCITQKLIPIAYMNLHLWILVRFERANFQFTCVNEPGNFSMHLKHYLGVLTTGISAALVKMVIAIRNQAADIFRCLAVKIP